METIIIPANTLLQIVKSKDIDTYHLIMNDKEAQRKFFMLCDYHDDIDEVIWRIRGDN